VPFIKGIQIGDRDGTDNKIDTHDLQLDYWVTKKDKKSESHKEVKSFGFAAITRLPGVATALNIESENRPSASTFSLMVHLKQSRKAVNKAMDAIKKGLSSKDEQTNQVSSKINRLICSSAGDNVVFRVLVDGLEEAGVKFVSLSPQWNSHFKTLPVQVFCVKPSTPNAPQRNQGQVL